MTVVEGPPEAPGQDGRWFARDQAAVVAELESDTDRGLSQAEAASRLARHGPNEIRGEAQPSVWAVALEQLREPMNIMLIAVTAVSFAVGGGPPRVPLGVLVLFNIPPGGRPGRKARR